MKTQFVIVLAALLAGCSSVQLANRETQPDVDEMHRVDRRNKGLSLDELKREWRKEFEGYVVTLRSEPEVPRVNETVNLNLTILRMVDGKTAPVSRAKVGGRSHIPMLTGNVHFSESNFECKETHPGVYHAVAVFHVFDEWEIDFNIVTRDGKSIGLDFPMRVRTRD